jgi:hypothetical protein
MILVGPQTPVGLPALEAADRTAPLTPLRYAARA